jgi:hypothetical protein
MTHRAADRRLPRRSPLRAPLLHTWPVPRSSPPREHARRALRLFVTAGCYAAGLCLVIALVAVVVALTGPGHASGLAADGKAHGSSSGAPTLAVLTKHGDARFSTTVHGQWRLRWFYDGCGSAGAAGYLIVTQVDLGKAGHIRVDGNGPHGRGVTRWFSGTGTHRFLVSSDCTWTTRVQQRR